MKITTRMETILNPADKGVNFGSFIVKRVYG